MWSNCQHKGTVHIYQECSATESTPELTTVYSTFVFKIVYLLRKYPELRNICPYFDVIVLIFYTL
jgi:hypothetical protein